MGQESLPLTDEERAELELLRAEREARLAEEQARRERAELEALRAERAEALRAEQRAATPVRGGAGDAAEERVERAERPRASRLAAGPTSAAERERIRRDAEARERGRRLMEPDEDLSMPFGQKVVLIAVALICIAAVLAMFVFPK